MLFKQNHYLAQTFPDCTCLTQTSLLIDQNQVHVHLSTPYGDLPESGIWLGRRDKWSIIETEIHLYRAMMKVEESSTSQEKNSGQAFNSQSPGLST